MTSPYARHTQNAPNTMDDPTMDHQGGGGNIQQGSAWRQPASLDPGAHQSWKARLDLAFQEDIPPPLRCLMIAFCVFLVLHIALQILNVVATGLFYDQCPGVIASSVFTAMLVSICAYLFWYRPLYAAFRDRSSFDYACFVLVFFGQLALYATQLSGVVPVWPGFLNDPVYHYDDSPYESISTLILSLGILECFQLFLGVILYWVTLCFWFSPLQNPIRL